MNDLEPEVIEYVGFRDLEPDGVVEQPFAERYNSFLEIPISIVASILVPLAILFGLVLYLGKEKAPDKKLLPVTMLSDGEDEKGAGSPGGGGGEELSLGAAMTPADLDRMPKMDIAKVKEELEDGYRAEGVTDIEIPESRAAAIGSLHESLRKKIAAGGARGSGGPGTGGPASKGTGPGGTGADSTHARALRWIIKFDRSGRDYVNQIGGLGGIIVMQLRDDNSRLYVFRNPQNGGPPKIASDEDIAEFTRLLQFTDTRGETVASVAEALGLNYTPPMFMVYFPKSFEMKLEKLEREYNGKESKQIKETIFRVIKSGGGFDLNVIGQTLR
jgi:hypothetical protein